MSLRVSILQISSIWVKSESGQVILSDILKMYVLLHFHESVDTLTIHDVLIDKVGEELKVQFDHFEVDEVCLEQL